MKTYHRKPETLKYLFNIRLIKKSYSKLCNTAVHTGALVTLTKNCNIKAPKEDRQILQHPKKNRGLTDP